MSLSFHAIVDAPIADVWAMISDFSNLMRWHPDVVSCHIQGQGQGAIRTVHFADRWAVEELSLIDDSAHKLIYAVIDASETPVIGISGTMTLNDLGEGRTQLEWASGLPDDDPDAAAVNGQLTLSYPHRVEHLRAALKTL